MCECANRTALCIASCASVGKTILFLPRFVNNRTLQQTTYAMSKDTADANATCTFCLIQPNCTKNAFINTENDIINAFLRKLLLFLLLYFCKMKTSTTKKKSAVCRFLHWKKYFPEFVFDFLHCNLPFAHGDCQSFFCCKLFASGNGKHDTSTTLYTVRMTKTATAKLFLHALQKRQIRIFRFDGQACGKPQRRQRNLKRFHGKRFACKRQRNFCASKNCTPNGLSDKYAFFV